MGCSCTKYLLPKSQNDSILEASLTLKYDKELCFSLFLILIKTRFSYCDEEADTERVQQGSSRALSTQSYTGLREVTRA